MIDHVHQHDDLFVPFDQLYQPRNEVVGRSRVKKNDQTLISLYLKKKE
jgi:hypothetical protein